MPYVWPTELDDAAGLLDLVGSFWSQTYSGSDFVASTLHAKAQQQAQAHLDLLDLVAAIGRFDVPVFRKENWTLVLLKESERNLPNLAKFDGTHAFDDGLLYGVPAPGPVAWPAPPGMVSAPVLTDRITAPTTTRTAGLDFYVAGGAVVFRTDPFLDPAAAVAESRTAAGLPDRVCALWAYRGEFDRDTVYLQFGYALAARFKSSPQYKRLVNAMFDALVEGTTVRAVEDFLSAVCDVPLAAADERVQLVTADARHKLVVTPKNVYALSNQARVTVAAGDELKAGDPVCDALVFHETNRGAVPDGVSALALGRGLLNSGYFRELVFENKDVPLVVEEGVDGYTRVSFAVSGWPGDVEKFWDDVHARGVAAGATLAMALDTRANKDGQPTAAALPATVNPLEFLVANLFRGSLTVVTCRPAAFGKGAVGLHAARLLRRLVPAWNALVILVRHDFADEVDPDLADEDVGVYLGQLIDEEIDPSAADEELVVTSIGGHCA